MGSDGREYKWNYRTVEGQEWSVSLRIPILRKTYIHEGLQSAQRPITFLLHITTSSPLMYAPMVYQAIH